MKTHREKPAGPWSAARSVRDQARARVQRAASAVVASSIEALAEHLPAALPALQSFRPQGAPDAADRIRTVLAIDRSTRAQAAPEVRPVTAPPPPPAAVPQQKPAAPAPDPRADAADGCDEPIRTRSMARLLAKQGHPQRALAILEYLLARSGSDGELRAEAEALRAQIAAG